MTGRTYKLAGYYVRIVRITKDTVTFGSAVKDVRLVNSTVTHEEFANLPLEETTTFDYDMKQYEQRVWN